jgi:Histidine phosphatase superfamily (branch 1)
MVRPCSGPASKGSWQGGGGQPWHEFRLIQVMKTLFLIRHAKSSWDDTALPDKDRPLGDRGRRDAPKMGKRLAKRDVKPDYYDLRPRRHLYRRVQDGRRREHAAPSSRRPPSRARGAEHLFPLGGTAAPRHRQAALLGMMRFKTIQNVQDASLERALVLPTFPAAKKPAETSGGDGSGLMASLGSSLAHQPTEVEEGARN